MADKTYLDLEGLKKYDALIKSKINEKEGTLNTAISGEKTRAEGAETTLNTAIGTEETRAKGAEKILTDAIASINNVDTGILKQAKDYADGKDTAISTAQTTANEAKEKAEGLETLIGTGYGEKTVKKYIDDKATEASGAAGKVATDLQTEINRAKGVEGELASLTTTAKGNLVAAINEVNGAAGTAQEGVDGLETLVGTGYGEGKTVKQYIDGEVTTINTTIGDTTALPDATKSVVENINAIGGNVTTLDTKVGTLPEGQTDVVSYASGLATSSQSGAVAASKVIMKEVAGEGSVLKTYTFYQGGEAETNKIGSIDIARDLVVTAGEVVKNPSGQPAGTYLKLTIANQTDPVYINVIDLVNDFTVEENASKIQLAISDTREISATVVAGSIAKTDLAEAVQTEITNATTAIGKAKVGETAGTGLTGRVESLEEAIGTGSVSEQITAAINELDSTVSTTETSPLSVTVTQTDGKLTAVTGSVATITESQINALFPASTPSEG